MGSSVLRLVTACVMLLMRMVRSLSESCGTTVVEMDAGLTVSSVVDSYTSGSFQITIYATATVTANVGSTISHFLRQIIRAISPGVRCRKSTLMAHSVREEAFSVQHSALSFGLADR